MIAPVIEPIFTFFAFGFGVGALVASKVEGLTYLSFVGAGVLAFTVLMRTIFEMNYGAHISGWFINLPTTRFSPRLLMPNL